MCTDIYSCVTLSLAGQVSISGHNEHFRRTPSEYILYIITGGNMILVENNIRYNLSRGDCLILTPGNTHYGIPNDSDISYIYLHFSPIPGAAADIPKYTQVDSSALEKLVSIYHEVNRICHEHDYLWQAESSCLLTHMLILLSRTVHVCNTPSGNRLITDITEFLNLRLHAKLGSADLEKTFHMNYDYLNRLFRAGTGMTIINYHNSLRIDEAERLLASGIYNVRQVSEILGFNNEFYFSKVYRKFKGIPPSLMLR